MNPQPRGRVYDDIAAERDRAHQKHKDSPGGSIEMRPWFADGFLRILVEEVGEVAKVLNDAEHGVYVEAVEIKAELRKELIQVAAMAAAWVDAIDRHRGVSQ